MKNLDVLEKQKQEIIQRMNEAIKNNDAETFQASFVEMCESIQQRVLEEAKALINETDQKILAARGVRQLTSKETEYYQAVIGAMKSQNPKQAIENLDVVMPFTIIDKVSKTFRKIIRCCQKFR